jgi:ribosomal protein S18 acetylase RimI-like enzyme
MAFSLDVLTADHPVAAFCCGTRSGADAIDLYLKSQALAEQSAGLSTAWVAMDHTKRVGTVIGYFTLSPTSVRLDVRVQQLLPTKVPYPNIGGYLLGRLGVDVHYQGGEWGRVLVAAAVDIAHQLRAAGGGVFLAVDPKNDRLAAWYDALDFGFVPLDPSGHRRRRILKLG